ncbi:GNAT family N-acetyltransferase [Oscillospiraceae bacterium LTW-04]|nr:N-acetyltransferase family protein [Oscillospiraceae bacterium MB24-C1]
MNNAILRMASVADAQSLLNIYAPYIKSTAVTSEEEVPSLNEFKNRITEALIKHPYIVCVIDDQIVGYAYGHSYRNRSSYRWGAELSVYVSNNCKSSSVGVALYSALIAILRLQGYQTVFGIVILPNLSSQRLHEYLGFSDKGVLTNACSKLGNWHDILTYEKHIGTFPANPPEIVPVTNLDDWDMREIFNRYASVVSNRKTILRLNKSRNGFWVIP